MSFVKMHGAGNSFAVIERDSDSPELSVLAVEYCGSVSPALDGLIAIMPSAYEYADFVMMFYNRDGSKGEMCGNGARCAARYAFEHGYCSDAGNIRFLATAGLILARRIDETEYEIRLNDPSVTVAHMEAEGFDCGYTELGDPGIPHAVIEVSKSPLGHQKELFESGRAVRKSSAFAKGANVTFAFRTGHNSFECVTFERGVEDFTLACGTGCGAVAAIMALRKNTSSNEVYITMPGGKLSVRFSKTGDIISDLFLTGPTAYFD